MSSLFQRRFLILSGKGGVGRTTVAAALARAAVHAGKRVLVAQMDSPERLGRLLGHAGGIGAEVTAVSEGLDAVNMTTKAAMRQYGLMVLKYEALYKTLFENKAVQGFLAAIPGLDAYAMLGKAWWHTTEQAEGRPRYDLVILDGPASGHTATMLRIPQAITEAMPKGPLAKDAVAMNALFRDPQRTAFVIVTLAEDLPARETSELARTVREGLKLPLGPLVVNGLPPAGPRRPEVQAVLGRVPTGDAALDATLTGAALLAARREEAEEVLERLRKDPGLPTIELPRLPTTDLGPAEIDELAKYFA
ncbi:MAG TPA: ArsA family ATPase [Polyangia bacterium]|nr:ArsA family ATPase [Polyangia bacterium]